MEIWITRHGQTYGNVADILQGHNGNKLTELGEEQAAKAGLRLAEEKFDYVYSSDLFRAK